MVWCLLVSWILVASAKAEDGYVVEVNAHFSAVIDLPQKANIIIRDPRVAAVRPMLGPHLHVQGISKGDTSLELTLQDGTQSTLTAHVKGGKPKGQVEVRTARGHSTIVELDVDALYVGAGDPHIAHVSMFGPRRVHVVGVAPGMTDLVIQGPAGSTVRMVRIQSAPDLSLGEMLDLSIGETRVVTPSARPSRYAVAHRGIAKATIVLTGVHPTLQVTGLAIGTTDLTVVAGPDSPVEVWTINVHP